MKPVRLASVPDISKKPGIVTPSQSPFPVFAMCQPLYVDNAIQNNPTMKEFAEPLNKEKFMAQWFNFYNVLAANSLVYLIVPVRGLQDEVYVNSFAYLPHIQDRDVIILSNFVGEGRAGEEIAAGTLFKDLGYEVEQCPYKFEGEPELKWLPGAKTYIGGYGFRSDIKAHNWLKEKYGAKIIPLRETDDVLYHLDCSAFPIGKDSVLLCTEIMERATVREIEKVANVIPVSKEDSYAGICNSLQVESQLYNASSLQYMRRGDKDYQQTKTKDENLQDICTKLGIEVTFFDLSECEKSGAKLSCFTSHLNFRL